MDSLPIMNRPNILPRKIAVVTGIALCHPSSGQSVWTGGGNSFWQESLNWSEGIPAAGDDLIIGSTAVNPLRLDDDRPVGTFKFGEDGDRIDGFAVQTGPANTLALSSGLLATGPFSSATVSLRLQGNFRIAGDQTWEIAGSEGSVTSDRAVGLLASLDEAVPGSVLLDGDLTKSGDGQLSLRGTSLSGSGDLIVNDGVLKLNGGSGLPLSLAGPGSIIINTPGGGLTGKLFTSQNSGGFGPWSRPLIMNGSAGWTHGGGNGTSGAISAPVTWNGTHALNVLGSLSSAGPWTGVGQVTKSGAFPLSLDGASPAFTGSLIGSQGLLRVGQAFGGNLQVTGGVMEILAPVAGNVSASSSSARLILGGSPGVSMVVGNLTAGTSAIVAGECLVEGNINLSGAKLRADPAAGALKANGNLTLSGTTSVELSGIPVPNQPFVVIECAGTLSSTATFQLESNSNYRSHSFSQAGKTITLTVDAINQTWSGSGSTWNTSTGSNWTSATPFKHLDFVRFDDAGGGGTVNLSGTLRPSSIVFDHDLDYTIAGSGALAGHAAIVKQGNGELRLGGASGQKFTGPVTVHDGTLVMTTDYALGYSSGIHVKEGARLDLNGQVPSEQASGDPARSYTFSIAGSGPDGDGALVNLGGKVQAQAGVRSLILDADATIGCTQGGRFDIGFSNMGGHGLIDGKGHLLTVKASNGPVGGGDDGIGFRGRATDLRIRVAEGMIWAEHFDDAFGGAGGEVTVEAGAKVGTFGPRSIPTPVILKESATLFNQSAPLGGAGTGSTGTWSGPVTLAGAAFIDPQSSRIVISGPIGEAPAGAPHGLTKIGSSVLTLSGSCTYRGTTEVATGTLLVHGEHGLAGAAPVQVQPGSTLGGTGRIHGAVNLAAGTLAPGGESSAEGGSVSTGTLRTGPLVLGPGSVLACEIDGPLVDRITVDGDLNLTGSTLNLIPLIQGLSEDLYILASYSGALTGFFNLPVTVPVNYSLHHNLAAKRIELVRQGGSTDFADWATAKGLAGDDALAAEDPDQDGDNNLTEFAFGTPPGSGTVPASRKSVIATVGGQQVFTLTVPVRTGAVFRGSPGLTASRHGVVYHVEAGTSPSAWSLQVSEVTGADATAIHGTLPALDPGWNYRTFRGPGTVAEAPSIFLRARAE